MKKIVSAIISILFASQSILAGMTVSASAAVYESGVLEIGESVKFDFGSTAAEGCIGVDASKDYFGGEDEASGLTYGFLGLGADGYSKLSLKNDSFEMVKDQQITLYNGGAANPANVADDNVYAYQSVTAPGSNISYDMGDGIVPVRFAMKAEGHSYYRVKATVGCADTSKPATVSIFNEKRHPVVTDMSIGKGDTYTVEFTANVMDVYYKNDKAVYADDMLNIAVVGENAGLAAIEITRLNPENAPKTIWVCSDSTGCDQPASVPFYRLQTYCGVGQYLSKYLTNMTVSNQGEGGLASGDNMHFYEATSQWKAGDYLYIQYGHNEKSAEEYKSNLEKYYTSAHKDGVKLIVVGPIDRVQDGRYDSESHTWSSSLNGYSAAGKEFVEEKISGGANDIAFIDLNAPWVSFLNTVTDEVASERQRLGMDSALTYNMAATHYYYTYNKSGSSDRTHINDAGADNAANIFYSQVKAAVAAGEQTGATQAEQVQAAVLKDIADDMRIASPYKVDDKVIRAGFAPNSLYPAKFNSRTEYPYSASIEDITVNDDGTLKSARVHVLQDLPQYAAVYVTGYDSNNKPIEFASSEHIDNTSDKSGAVKEVAFNSDIVPSSFSVRVYYCDQNNQKLTDAEYSSAVSAEYTPVSVLRTLIDEDFSNISEGSSIYSNGWSGYGSMSTRTMTKKTDTNGGSYADIVANGSGSAYTWKGFSPAVESGKLEITFSMRINSGSVNFLTGTGRQSNKYGNTNSAVSVSGTTVKLGSSGLSDTAGIVNIGEWVDYKYLVDIDNAKASLTVSGYDTVSGDTTFNTQSITQFMIDAPSSKPFDIDIKNIKVRAVERYAAPQLPEITPEPEGRLPVQSSGFENPLGSKDTSWNFYTGSTENWIPVNDGCTISDTEAHTGTHSLALTNGTVGQQINDWELYGVTYVVEAWVKGEGQCRLMIGKQYAANNKWPLTNPVAETTVQGNNKWTKVSLAYKTFKGWGNTSKYGFVIGIQGKDSTIYIDDVTITKAADSTQVVVEAEENEIKDAVGFTHSFKESAASITWCVSNGTETKTVEFNTPQITGSGEKVIGLLITGVPADKADAVSAAVLVR